jgi:hypothetical protein
MRTSSNIVHVAPKYRTNSLSHKSGGYTIAVILKSGLKLIYDNIHYPNSYAAAIHGDNIVEVIIFE